MTQIFPLLLPLRVAQRKMCFYTNMHFDSHKYAKTKSTNALNYCTFEAETQLINENTGLDIQYQKNKVYNLKIASKSFNGLLISPGETFSFWQLMKHAKNGGRYKKGLILQDGNLIAVERGGLCHLSNFLFWMFLHTPLTIVERHPHQIKDFPSPDERELDGVDATIHEGWLDLKVKNNTSMTFQILLNFQGTYLHGRIQANCPVNTQYHIVNRDKVYYKNNGKVYEKVSVYKQEFEPDKMVAESFLYADEFEIGYPLPENIERLEIEKYSMNKKTIAILFGGHSTEYEVSLQSACSVIENLNPEKHNVILLGITRQGAWLKYSGELNHIRDDSWSRHASCIPAILSPDRNTHGLLLLDGDIVTTMRIDVAFPVLHGKNGEDGTVQGLLELAGIPCVGCGTLSSALCMDKDMAHRLVSQAGIKTPNSAVLESSENPLDKTSQLRCPLFVKPANAGSSFGITKIMDTSELENAVLMAFQHDRKVVVEEAINGFEVGCAILGNDTLTLGEVDEIELSQGFFDYTEKYTLKTSSIHMPARIDRDTADRIRQTAAKIYRVLGCKGYARVDLFLTPENEIVFNEVNTIPGFTSHSRYPNMLKGIGFSFPQIVDNLIDLAVEK